MSKASRRRKQRRKAAAKNAENTVEYINYKVAVQKVDGEPVYISTVREHDREQLFPFIARMYEVKYVKSFTFFEVHRILDSGNVEILANGGDWPKGAAIISNKGYTVRSKTERALTVVAPKPAVKHTLPKIVIGGMASIPVRKYSLRVLT